MYVCDLFVGDSNINDCTPYFNDKILMTQMITGNYNIITIIIVLEEILRKKTKLNNNKIKSNIVHW